MRLGKEVNHRWEGHISVLLDVIGTIDDASCARDPFPWFATEQTIVAMSQG